MSSERSGWRWFSVVLMLAASAPAGSALAEWKPRPRRVDSAEPVVAWVLGARVGAGFSFGGDELRVVEGLRAGAGGTATIGASLTPLWWAGHGLGVAVDIGVKYEAGQTLAGGISLRRFPIVTSLHALLNVHEHWFVTLAAGPFLEHAIEWSQGQDRNQVTGHLDDEWGFLAEAGMLYVDGRIGIGGSLRYSTISYHEPARVTADHAGMFFALHYFF
jgi:hypothetical protein